MPKFTCKKRFEFEIEFDIEAKTQDEAIELLEEHDVDEFLKREVALESQSVASFIYTPRDPGRPIHV